MQRFLPAIPTVVLSAIFAIDFEGILYRLYLSIFLFYAGFVVLVLVLFAILAFRNRSIRAPLPLSCLLVLVGAVALPLLELPVAKGIENHTGWNRSFAVVHTHYEGTNRFEFIITAQGKGSWKTLTLDSGYTNISINGNFARGPSLYYDLRPDRTLRDKRTGTDVPLDTSALVEAYGAIGLGDIANDRNVDDFRSILEALSGISSVRQFESRFGELEGSELRLGAFPNATYRVCFLIIALLAVILSAFMAPGDSPAAGRQEPS